MDRIETLQLRPYRQSDKEGAIETFHQLTLQGPNAGLRDILLLQDTTLQSDLCIVLRWRQEAMHVGKSRLGIQLAAVFSEFGSIDHTIWSNTGAIYNSYRKPEGLHARSTVKKTRSKYPSQ